AVEVGDQMRVRERDRALPRKAAREADLLVGERRVLAADVEVDVPEQPSVALERDEERREHAELLAGELRQRLEVRARRDREALRAKRIEERSEREQRHLEVHDLAIDVLHVAADGDRA